MGMYGSVIALTAADYERVCRDPDVLGEFTNFENPQAACCDLQKAWHGLHFLLTGEADPTELPLGFIVGGGVPVEGNDSEYGSTRWVTPENVRSINEILLPMSDDDLWAHFNPEVMNEKGVYPVIWDEEEADLREEYTMYFQDIKKFVAEAAASGMGLVVMIE